jgi:hypothetical protein
MQRSDDELLARTPAGPEAFGEFYVRHETAVLGFMLRRTAPELRCSESVVRQRVSRGLATLRKITEEAS